MMSIICEIENFIEAHSGTAIGEAVRNMFGNYCDGGCTLEYICEYADIPYSEGDE